MKSLPDSLIYSCPNSLVAESLNPKITPNSLVNLRLELSMIEQEFLIGFNGLHLFLDYNGKNFLSQSVY
jgi:hypothetical protein